MTVMNNKYTILLVEDDADHAHLIKRHLSKVDRGSYDVVHVESVSDAVKQISNNRFAAVLLDLSLPDSPINKTLEHIVDSEPNAPVIVLTSINNLELATQALQQGAQDYIVKSELGQEVLHRAIQYAIERNRVQQQLEEYAAKLEESNEHLEGFAHTLAHEVRSPLTVISGCLQIIDQSYLEVLDDNTKEILHDSLTATRCITELVETLLEYSQAGSHSDSFATVDLETEFFHVYAILRPMLTETNATIEHDPLPKVHGNDIQLRQLLQNLVTNALKFRGNDPPKIRIGCKESDEGWIVYVADNGKGIPREDQKKIFEAFTRLDDSQSIAGVGIGLAFCKRIIESHHGKIWVESEPGKGSKFFVELKKSLN